MSDPPDGEIHAASDAGVTAHHPSSGQFQLLVAPSTTAAWGNAARLPLAAVACWRVDDIRFLFDSSFVLASLREEMRLLAELIGAHSDTDPANPQVTRVPPLSIFGHADPVGDDEYNKALSGRRAAAIYGLVTRRAEVWEDLYSNTGAFAQPLPGDKWGTAAIQTMLSELGIPVAVDGIAGPQTQEAVREFQKKNNLSADGDAGPATRKKLFLAYMDRVCVDDADEPFLCDPKSGFLAQNADTGGKGDFQGCSEFNPKLIFSETKNAAFEQAEDKTTRNEANAINRRVIVLLFRPGAVVIPAKWPCPRAKESSAGCRKRFWSDGEKRRSARLPDKDRQYEETKDTFACRFYDRAANTSPCEGVLPLWSIRLFDASATVMANAPYRLKIGSELRKGFSDAQGWVRERSVKVPVRCLLEWGTYDGDPTSKILLYQTELQLDFEGGAPGEQDEWRLRNLGYGFDCTFKEGVRHFQNDYGLPVTGEIDNATSGKLKAVHDSCSLSRKQPSAPDLDSE